MVSNPKELTIYRGDGRLETVKSTAFYGGGNLNYDSFSASMQRAIGTDDSGLALAYAATVWSFNCVNVGGNAFSGVPFHVYNKATGKIVPDHALIEAIRASYRWRNRDLMFDVWASLQLWGELYIEKMYNIFRMPSGLKWINPLVIEPNLMRGEIIDFTVSDMFAGKSYRLSTDAVAYYRLFNSMDDNRGISPMTIAMDDINVARSIQKSSKAWYENESRPDYLMTPKVGASLTADAIKAIREWLASTLKGQKNRGRGVVIDAPMDFTAVQREPIPTQVELSDSQAEKICAAFGVPPAIAGRWTNVTYDNAEEQDQLFYDKRIEPETAKIDRFFTEIILPFFDSSDTCEFKHDFTAIKSKAASSQKNVASASTQYHDGVISMNEYRVQTGKQAVPGGDIFLIPAGSVIVNLTDLPNAANIVNVAPPPAMGLPTAIDTHAPVTSGADVATTTDAIPVQLQEPTKAAGELLKWERSSVKNGKNKALRFVADNVPEHIQSYVKTALIGVDFEDKQQVRGVFTKATAMLNIDESSMEDLALSTVNHAPDITADEVTAARAYLEQMGAIDVVRESE